MPRVRALAPTRIDLAGGTLDIWPIPHLLDAKATVNVGVTLMACADVETTSGRDCVLQSEDQGETLAGSFKALTLSSRLPLLSLLLAAIWREDLPKIKLTTSAESPAGAGLGGSSCLGIAVAGALWRTRHLCDGSPLPTDQQLVQLVQDVEARVIRTPTGIQDYWGGLRGQINLLRYPFGSIDVETLSPDKLPALGEELILCFSGKSRASAINNWEIFKRLFDGDRDLLGTFNAIGRCAAQCAEAAQAGDYEQVLALSAEEWQLRTRLWPNIETPETQRIDQAARGAGARFTRVCGAGGGGVMAVFAPLGRRSAVISAMQAAGGSILPATVATAGLTLEVH